ncbi:MAG: flagellar rod assembly protein/muramidase FlgJ [Gammaproteobacteria bacterium]|nr:MAG: flagellar rod assembly protein/muramidase FlgJ [Gammaproteobacteria bacterium]
MLAAPPVDWFTTVLQTPPEPTADAAELDRAAERFEALFLQQMLTAMRRAVPKSGLFDDTAMDLYGDMLDRELALHWARQQRLGIAEAVARQLRADAGRADAGSAAVGRAAPPAGRRSLGEGAAFTANLRPIVERALRGRPLPPEAVLAVAALETGWGRHVAPRTEGGSSHNLFNIKAGHDWRGERVWRDTLEFEAGVWRRRRDAFRAYPDPAAAVADFVALLGRSPRYAGLLDTAEPAAFFRGLQAAGYATDPDYAAKLERVLARVELALKDIGRRAAMNEAVHGPNTQRGTADG